MAKQPRVKPAIISAFTVEVSCPHCGETLPDPEGGSVFWTVEQLRDEAAKGETRTCDSCEEPFRVHFNRPVYDPKLPELTDKAAS